MRSTQIEGVAREGARPTKAGKACRLVWDDDFPERAKLEIPKTIANDRVLRKLGRMRLAPFFSMLALLLGACVGVPVIRADALAWFLTPLGAMEVVLFDQDKPSTVQNFVRLVKSGAYQNSFFHRCETNFVLQGGGYWVANPTNSSLARQFYTVPHFGAISNEFNVGRVIPNEFGTIAMAKQPDKPHSATSQWFFNLTNNSAKLDVQNGGFTVFGRVVRGGEVLLFFRTLELGGGIVDMRYWYGATLDAFARLPVQYYGIVPPFYPDLWYLQIWLLEAKISLGLRGEPEITWQSVYDRMNYVEYTTHLNPADWRVLKAVTGDGRLLTVTDSSAPKTLRYYRVRVDY